MITCSTRDPDVAGEQEVDRAAPLAASCPARRGAASWSSGVGPSIETCTWRVFARARRVGHGVVDEPAVRVEDDPVDAGRVDSLDRLERHLAPEQRLAAGDDRLSYPELDRLADDPPPGLVVELRGALEGAARRVRVAEAAAQVAVVGQLELRPVGALCHRLGRRSGAPYALRSPAPGVPPERPGWPP